MPLSCNWTKYVVISCIVVLFVSQGVQLERKLNTGHYFNEYEQLPRKRFVSIFNISGFFENKKNVDVVVG